MCIWSDDDDEIDVFSNETGELNLCKCTVCDKHFLYMCKSDKYEDDDGYLSDVGSFSKNFLSKDLDWSKICSIECYKDLKDRIDVKKYKMKN